jgi:hypothetical protein
MTSKRPTQRKSQLPVRPNLASFLIYDRKTGEVFHIHHVGVLPGAALPPDDKLEELLIQHAVGTTKRTAAQLGAVRCRKKNLGNPAMFRVHPKTRRISMVKQRPSSDTTSTLIGRLRSGS